MGYWYLIGAFMIDESLDVVNENNEIIGREKRKVIHSKGLLHRSSIVLIFNSKGQIFLQKRSNNKKICPSMWDVSVAETLKSGEDYTQAAIRGIKEELDINNKKIIRFRGPHLQKNNYEHGRIKDYEFVETYHLRSDEKIKIDKIELDDGCFFDILAVKNMIKENKNQFTPWFLEEWNYLEDENLLSFY
jgi:isopentenyldiphosphate isomerase